MEELNASLPQALVTPQDVEDLKYSQVETVCPRSCISFCGARPMFRLTIDRQFYVKFVPSIYSIVWEFPTSDICFRAWDQSTIKGDAYLTFDVYQKTIRRYGAANMG